MTENLSIFVPLSKVDHSQQTVMGVLAEEAPDKSGEVFDWPTGKAAVMAWSESFKKTTGAVEGQEQSAGNLRVMHTDQAVGKFLEVTPDDETKQIHVTAKILDDDTWKKVVGGVFTGFSLGGSYEKKWADPSDEKLTRYTPKVVEGSLADNPCMYGSVITAIKMDGAEAMLKLVGAKEAQKDAQSLANAADDALASVKKVLVELGQLESVETMAIEDVATALRRLLWVKEDAEFLASQEGEAMTLAASQGGLAKWVASYLPQLQALQTLHKAGIHQVLPAQAAATAQTVEGQELTKLTDEQAEQIEACVKKLKAEGKDKETAFAICTASVTKKMEQVEPETAGCIAKAFRLAWDAPEDHEPDEDMAKTIKAVAESGLLKTAIQEAVKSELAEPMAKMDGLEKRLEQVEGTPAAVGRAVQAATKSLGSQPTGEKPVDVDSLGKAVDLLEGAGALSGLQLQQLRVNLSALSMPTTPKST